MRSGDRASCGPSRCGTSPHGWTSTGRSGRDVSIGWTPFSVSFRRRSRAMTAMPEPRTSDRARSRSRSSVRQGALTMPSTPTATLSIPDLRATITGRVIAPDDEGYDEARTVVLGGIDRRPRVIVRVADADDVARVISLARETGLPLAVRCGGHSGAAHSVVDDGIVLDVRDLKELDIDVDARTAWAGAGLTAAEYTTAAA